MIRWQRAGSSSEAVVPALMPASAVLGRLKKADFEKKVIFT